MRVNRLPRVSRNSRLHGEHMYRRGGANLEMPATASGALTFIDLFAGAGGLSLGLMQAGLEGLFAVEKDSDAFATIRANLIDGSRFRYCWPDWLPKEPMDVARLVKGYRANLYDLRGQIDVLAGGPPCQGFSSAGRRRQHDPRNRLFQLYVQVAEILQPKFVVFENVPGIAVVFDLGKRKRNNPRAVGRPPMPYSERLARRLSKIGYDVVGFHERADEFGVPQSRTRYLMVGVRRDLGIEISADVVRGLLAESRDKLLASLRLSVPVSLQEAISDLEVVGRQLVPCEDTPGYEQIVYEGPATHYQHLMNDGAQSPPNSLRLAKHTPATVERLREILRTCKKGVRLSPEDRRRLGIKKSSTTPLAPDRPSKTVTSLPDDFVHYAEPRILTVRECARLQSFPDWFQFQGKYTTGGDRRKVEVPRYTQVANAVPPLLARVIGRALIQLHLRGQSGVASLEAGAVPDGSYAVVTES